MKITILTTFPEVFESFLKMLLVDWALKKGIATINIVDIKPHAGRGAFRHIDDTRYRDGLWITSSFAETPRETKDPIKKNQRRR